MLEGEVPFFEGGDELATHAGKYPDTEGEEHDGGEGDGGFEA